jgi:S1-C subfamily serine protease
MMLLPDAIERVRLSVVQILIGGAQGVRPIALGTGFIVHPSGLLVTAGHVVTDAFAFATQTQIPQPGLRIGLAQPNTDNMRGNFLLVPGDLVEHDVRRDLALIRISHQFVKADIFAGIILGGEPVKLSIDVAELSADRPRDGESVAISGYPLNERVLVTTSGAIATAWGLDVQEVTPAGMPSDFSQPDFMDCYLADVAVNGGNSGGPVYRVEDGTVIGVCRAYRGAPVMAGDTPAILEGKGLAFNSGLSQVVPIRYAEDLVGRHLTDA